MVKSTCESVLFCFDWQKQLYGLDFDSFFCLKIVDQEWSSALKNSNCALKNPNPMCLMQDCVVAVFWEGSG